MKTDSDKRYCNHLENVAIMLLPNCSKKDISMDTESIRGYESPLNYCGQILYKQYKIKTLNGMLPICSKCKKIRDDQGYWSQIDY